MWQIDNRVLIRNGFKVMGKLVMNLKFKYQRDYYIKELNNLKDYYNDIDEMYDAKWLKNIYDSISFDPINKIFSGIKKDLKVQDELKSDIDFEINKILNVINKYTDKNKKDEMKQNIKYILDNKKPEEIVGALKLKFIWLIDNSDIPDDYFENKKDVLISEIKWLISSDKNKFFINKYSLYLKKIVNSDLDTIYKIGDLQKLIKEMKE